MKNNNEVVNILGIKRTGNHLVINMLIKNAFDARNVIWGPKYNDVYSPSSTPPRYALLKELDRVHNSKKNTSLILSYENLPLELFKDLEVVKLHKELLADSVVKNILILRDPFNFIASYLRLLDNYLEAGLKHLPLLTFPLSDVKRLWNSYAGEYIGLTNYLNNVSVINYNEWVMSRKYRNSFLTNVFNIKNEDKGLNDVLTFGGGSSFDGMKYRESGSLMRTAERWKFYVKDERFRSFITGEEIEKLARRIYPNLSEVVYNAI